MMEITTGMVIEGVSVLGVLACLVGLLVTIPMFRKQRKKLLDKIEAE